MTEQEKDESIQECRGHWLPAVLGLVIAGIGLAVITGWFLRLPAIIQLHPELVPMQYNTALGFVLAGMGVIALACSTLMLVRTAAGLTTLLGAATLMQYLSGADFGIDQMLMDAYLTTKTSHPGRMAPLTALGFLLGGAGLLLASWAPRIPHANTLSAFLGISVCVLALATLISSATDLMPLVGWGATTPMALHTAFAHLLLGTTLIAGWVGRQPLRQLDWGRFGALLNFGVVALLSMLLWHGLQRSHDEQLTRKLAADARWLAERIDSAYSVRVTAIERMAQRWEAQGTPPRQIWEQDAATYLSDLPGLQAIEWIDAAGRVKWSIPPSDSGIGEGNADESGRAQLFERARQERRSVTSGAIPLARGGQGLLYVRPLFAGSRPDGYLVTALRIDMLSALPAGGDLMFGNTFAIEYDGREVFRKAASEITHIEQVRVRTPLALDGGTWQLSLFPDIKVVEALHSPLPVAVLVGGLLAALFESALIWQWGLLRRRTAVVEKTNAALAESEKRLNKSQEIAHLGSWELDLTRNTLTWSDETYRIFGLQRHEFAETYEAFLDAVHPDDRAAVDKAFSDSVREGKDCYEIEHRIIRKASEDIRWVQERCTHTRDEDGRIIRSDGMALDITERIKNETQLRETEQRFIFAVEGAGDGVWDWNMTTGDMRLSANYETMLGYRKGEIPETVEAWKQSVHPNDIAPVQQHLLDYLEGRMDSYDVELRLRCKDGGYKWILCRGTVVGRDEKGTPVRMIGIHSDISSQKHTEQDLRKITRAIENAPTAVIIADAEARIEYVNPQFTNITGYDAEEAIGKNPRFLKSGIHSPEFYQAMWANLKVGRQWHGEICNKRKNGELYWESASISPVLDDRGTITHYVTIKEDITERKQTEKMLVTLKEQAEAANLAKSAFLATMSHEIRTPMNGVIGSVDLLRRASLNPYQAELADTIHDSATGLLGIIDDILDFSKIEAGRMDLERESLCLARVVESACDALQPLAAHKQVRLGMFVDPLLPERILGDAVRLRQIINNLVSNAVKFSAGQDRQGVVRVRAEPRGGGACVPVGER